jgi:hypothetical protein
MQLVFQLGSGKKGIKCVARIWNVRDRRYKRSNEALQKLNALADFEFQLFEREYELSE